LPQRRNRQADRETDTLPIENVKVRSQKEKEEDSKIIKGLSNLKKYFKITFVRNKP